MWERSGSSLGRFSELAGRCGRTLTVVVESWDVEVAVVVVLSVWNQSAHDQRNQNCSQAFEPTVVVVSVVVELLVVLSV